VKKISLNVVPPPRDEQVGLTPPESVQLSEPMRRFACNQKGCCCSGWDIPFRLEDFLRLHEHLPESERGNLTHGIRLVLEQGTTEAGDQILHSLKLDGVGDDRSCRFLAGDGGCGVHAKHGLGARFVSLACQHHAEAIERDAHQCAVAGLLGDVKRAAGEGFRFAVASLDMKGQGEVGQSRRKPLILGTIFLLGPTEGLPAKGFGDAEFVVIESLSGGEHCAKNDQQEKAHDDDRMDFLSASKG